MSLVAGAAGATGAAGSAHAEPRPLPLGEIITVAVRQSPELARARIDVDAARAELLRAEGASDTHVGIRADTSVLRASDRDQTGDADSTSVTLSVSRALPTGGTLSVSAVGERARRLGVVRDEKDPNNPDDDEFPTAEFVRYSTAPVIGLTQPLLRGAGAGFSAPVRGAAAQRDAAVLRSEARARDLVVSIAQAYWQVAFAWRQLEVRKASLELAQKQLAFTEAAIRTEKVPRTETLAVQAAIATRKQDVIAGEQELYERSVALRQLGGLEIEPDEIVVATEPLPPRIDAPEIDPAAIVREAFARSAELAALEAARKAAEIGAGAADNAARPQLDLGISASLVGADDTLYRAVKGVTDDPGYSISANLTFDHAFERRVERGGQAAARAQVLAARTAEREARARLAVRATRAVQRARAALASIALGNEAISLAEQNVAAEQKRFELARSTNFEVLRRQDELEQARLRHAAAVTDYLTARADLDGLNGAILARYGIVMP